MVQENFFHESIPVSYTHLDVYKRQVYDQKLHEISGDACGNPEDSIQKAMYASLKNEGLEDVECVRCV